MYQTCFILQDIRKTVRLSAFGFSLVLHAGLVALLLVSHISYKSPAEFVTVDLIGGAKEVIGTSVSPAVSTPAKVKNRPPKKSTVAVEPLDQTSSASTETSSSKDQVDVAYQIDQYLGNTSGSSDPRSIYFTKIFRQISRVKSYPTMARQLSIQGQVKLLLVVSNSGEIFEAKAVSYDHEILKQASLDAIKKVGKFEPPPFEIQGSSFSLMIPLRYQLK